MKEALTEKGLFRGRKDHEYAPGRCLRCRTVVEPKLSLQWFVDTSEMAKRAIQAVREGSTQFVPKQQEHRFFEWLDKKIPWCISRQLWWGHRIPIWSQDLELNVPAGPEHENRGPSPQAVAALDKAIGGPFSKLFKKHYMPLAIGIRLTTGHYETADSLTFSYQRQVGN